MSTREFNRKARLLQEFLEKDTAELGRESGFVQRQSKMDGEVFAKTVILGWLENPEATLNDLVQSCLHLGVAISESGIHQRFTGQAVEFLRTLFNRGIQQLQGRTRLPAEVLKPFSQVNILDSSLITLPETLHTVFRGYGTNGGAASAKLQLSFDYLTGDLNAVNLTAGREPDQNCQLHTNYASVDSLHLFDLGYFKQTVFSALAQAQAYFISRLQTQTALYKQPDDEQALDLVAHLRKQTASCGELSVHLGRKTRLPVRLVFQRLAPHIVQERRRKARAKARRQGKTCSLTHLTLLEWTLLITNVPVAWLSDEQVTAVYRVRWQAELVFKLWKSQAKIAQVGRCGRHRFLCQLYARLLALLLFQWTIAARRFSQTTELSLPKAFRVLRRYAFRLLDAIADGWRLAPDLLAQIDAALLRFALKNSRLKSPSTYQRLVVSGA